ncbi:uncharacterized protein BO97DRAFT_399155 [Aspergillus homomorphus CBS 101889]|uniref:GPI anchored serine-threonine rich protein n=1 Tax=Aspergillus homomorphus (strain CBS 101889) TaxID=1450537 RepID=A0A395HM48_ASPHC|nr:hypothetical protein BO97DRAFT_399155 [Aspergillus homomorphus CBS 101889]RAL07938.1 hypothetical protein BO97DRAFT_399155 [Aspergillus homomorphus CBS 101889]
MRPSLILLVPLVATSTAHGLTQVDALHLLKRQSGAFIPGTSSVTDCPEGSILCGTSNTCYFPSRGDTCCPGGTWACPSDSFCLQDPYCCPTGLDRETCAQQYGITLAPTVTSATAAEPTSAPSTSTSSPTSSVERPSSSSSSSSSTTSVPVIPAISIPSSIASSSVHSGSATVVSSSTPSPSGGLFTGGAHTREMAGGALVLGGLGMVANIL